MTTIKGLLDSVERLNLRLEIPIIIENTKDEIILLNQSQMYQLNITKDGEKIKPAYFSEAYEKLKMALNPNLSTGRVDLFYTGEFYNSMNLIVDNYTYELFSTSYKSDKLERKYGENILGLTEDSKDEYIKKTLLNSIKLYIETTSLLRFT